MEVTESAPVCPAKEQHALQKIEGAATADNSDICVATSSSTTKEEVEMNTLTRTVEGLKANKNNPEGVKAFELAESVEGEEETDDETDDESDDGEMRQFLQLMNKAERKNENKVRAPVGSRHCCTLDRFAKTNFVDSDLPIQSLSSFKDLIG